VRYDRVLERLTPFPAELPPPGEALLPIVLDDRLRGPRVPPPGIVPKASAVLVLIHPDADGEARVVLTKRATRDGYHSGEVCFPGGRDEPGDDGAAGTALREAAEEVALDAAASGVRVLGQLDRVWIPVSNFDITPIVAVTDRVPALHPSEAEVALIVHARLDAFVPGAPVEVMERQIGDWPIRFGAYPIDGLAVWGATARILSQLGALVAAAGDRVEGTR
jgi:8-oxo-dGTP pyrophosphatase MutT (NUDIX family)